MNRIFLADSDRHKPRMTGRNTDLLHMMSGTGKIFIAGTTIYAQTFPLLPEGLHAHRHLSTRYINHLSRLVWTIQIHQPLPSITYTAHKIAAGQRSLSGTNSCVTGRNYFLPVTMSGKFSKFRNHKDSLSVD